MQARLGNVSHCMFKRPHNRIHNEFELRRWQPADGGEAMQVDAADKVEEAHAVLGELLEVVADHLDRALERGVQHCWDLIDHVDLTMKRLVFSLNKKKFAVHTSSFSTQVAIRLRTSASRAWGGLRA